MATKESTAQGKAVVIVESPAKTRTLQNFLGKDFEILASMGHIRDLPKSEMGVDVGESFEPTYVVIPERRQMLTKLRSAIKGAKTVYLASDPDREGEAIAWHLAEALNLHNAQRLEFHEITRSAVEAALQHPRTIDMHRVEAQQARRVLDRLVGYTLSPLLMQKSRFKAKSAGRVQSVAVRLVVDREREILAFDSREYWTIEAWLSPDEDGDPFAAKLVKKAGEKIELNSEEAAKAALEEIWNSEFFVKQIKLSEQFRNAPAPFTTSTLQQDASVRLGFSPRRTMAIAQQLYEGLDVGDGHVGLITYMRTDSVKIADQAKAQAKEFIKGTYGDEYAPKTAREHKSSKSAQEAHEAIRPTSVTRTPQEMDRHLDGDQMKLYTLIWNRFVASQMAAVRLAIRTAGIHAGEWEFEAKEVKLAFAGFSLVYPIRDKEILLPALAEGQFLYLQGLSEEQHFTDPPARFTEASLVKELEANGIGRPSTYAPILELIRERGYVYLDDKRKLRPTDLGFAVTDTLVEHFPDIMEVKFTATIETEFDEIEEGKSPWKEVVKDFYGPFSSDLKEAEKGMEPIRLPGTPTDVVCEECGKPMVQRTGRTGPFLACSGYPECKNTKPMPGTELPVPEEMQTCEKCGKPMVMRRGRYGPFLGCSGYPECDNIVKIRKGGGYSRARSKSADNGEVAATDAAAAPANGEAAAEGAEAVPQQNCEKCGKPMILRRGRYGPFLGCSGYPKCRNLINLKGNNHKQAEAAGGETTAAAEAISAAAEAAPASNGDPEVQQNCEKCGKPMVLRRGRFGSFWGCSGYPKCKNILKPKSDKKSKSAKDATADEGEPSPAEK